MASNQFLTLNSGHKMPIIGLGTWNASDQEVEAAIDAALEAGYRHIDTAPVYLNEKAIGRALKRWLDSGKVKREELFIVTKLPTSANRARDVEATIKKSLADLQLDYVDIYLIHSPVSAEANPDGSLKFGADGLMVPDLEADITTTWTAMEKLVSSGLAKSVGVSNFDQEQLERVLKVAKIPPATNQIEHHVYLQQRDLVDFCKAKGIVITAYSPLGSKGLIKVNASAGINRELPDLFNIPEVKEIAAAHGKTPAQVLLRWIVDNGIVIIPKSSNLERLKQNLNVFDFKLTTEEIAKLSALDQNFRICDWSLLPGVQRHPEYKF